MIHAHTGQPQPCPICDSSDVRWHDRRWYDVVRTTVRSWFEGLARVFDAGRPTRVAPQRALSSSSQTIERELRLGFGSDEEVAKVAAEMRYDVRRDAYNARVSMTTADRFWSCNSCGRKGEVFDDAQELLADRAELAALEDQMNAEPGKITRPIDRSGLQ